jgi:hypothetical protein
MVRPATPLSRASSRIDHPIFGFAREGRTYPGRLRFFFLRRSRGAEARSNVIVAASCDEGTRSSLHTGT